MLFNSFQYLIFFIIVATTYFLISHRYRWIFLLVASYYFYMCWNVVYSFLIIASTISVYTAGIFIEKQNKTINKKRILIAALLFNLAILFFFKYFNFFNNSLQVFLSKFNIFYNVPTLRLLLPVGISFYTFQAISYIVDVYRGGTRAERHFGRFALYISFFPKLATGPIERAKDLLPQFYEKHEFCYQRIADGLKLIAWGLFKKMVIADRLAVYVDQVYNNPAYYTGMPVIMATVFCAIQVLCDFSGYTDIALGSAQVLGVRLTNNFNRPFSAKSVSEFWRRWHISLSSWLKDYLYDPILISTRNWGKISIFYSLIITFVVCGLWHGANWQFVIFGLLHGLMISLEVATKKSRKRIKTICPEMLYNSMSLLLTFSYVCFTFIFFRANTIADAVMIIKNIFSISLANLSIGVPLVSQTDLLVAFFSLGILEGFHILQRKMPLREFVARKFIFRWTLYVAFVSFILTFRKTGSDFIYFQF